MDVESFKIYKTTEEYKALSPKSKRKLRDKFRYMEQREEKLEYQKEYDETHKEEKKLLREEKTKSKKRIKQRHDMKRRLLENPKHELGKRMFHLVTTGEIDLDIFGKIDDDDLEYLKTFVLPGIPKPERKEEKQKYYEEHREEKLDYAKSYRGKKKEEEDEKLINWKFRINDPNAVITAAEIQMKPLSYLDRFCQKEISKYEKFHFLEESEKEKYLEKCEEEHKSYLKEVESLSLSEKKQFLKK